VAASPAGAVVPVRLASPDAPDAPASAWVHVARAATWLRATAPGAPGQGARAFLVVRVVGQTGVISTVWDVRGRVRGVATRDDVLAVALADGAVDEHHPGDRGWRVRRAGGPTLCLAGPVTDDAGVEEWPARSAPASVPRALVVDGAPLVVVIGEGHYRRTEAPWAEADRPRAEVRLAARASALGPVLVAEVQVWKDGPPTFAPARAENELDNEHPDINSDGVQLHAALADDLAPHVWLLVPEPPTGRVRVTPRTPGAPPVDATWSPAPGGWRLRCAVPLPPRGETAGGVALSLALAVNEIPATRDRRRGQLVLGGAAPGYLYLQGDRLDPVDYLRLDVR
jgi:hypothetical protein